MWAMLVQFASWARFALASVWALLDVVVKALAVVAIYRLWRESERE